MDLFARIAAHLANPRALDTIVVRPDGLEVKVHLIGRVFLIIEPPCGLYRSQRPWEDIVAHVYMNPCADASLLAAEIQRIVELAMVAVMNWPRDAEEETAEKRQRVHTLADE